MSKNIFADFDFDSYFELLEMANVEQVHLVHHNLGFGGFSFCWQRCTEYPGNKMVKVSVSFCSEKDQFCRKIGAFHALDTFFAGQLIMLPVGDQDSAVIVQRLRNIFLEAVLDNYDEDYSF